MALKEVDQTENSLVRLRLAVDLAIRNDSHLTAIFVREGVLLWLARRDVMPFNPGLLRPAQDRHPGEFSAHCQRRT